ncbi:hypothetical protein C8J56DRAFT_1165331 [Mycena floridula]|nr:hypothetical protein C8J56DRAFT_1165331 [Mycena floridula]
MTSQLDIFPDIPDDVIRLIFEAAVEADRSAALNLVLLARHVQKWIQPLQFKAVCLRDEQGAETFLQEVTSNPTRLGIHVITLRLGGLGPDLAKAIVHSLPHLSTLSIWLYSYEIHPFFSSRLPSLRRMCLSLGHYWDFGSEPLREAVIPFLPESLTHFNLYGCVGYPLVSYERLKHMTRLTHLIVRYEWDVANGDICDFVEKLLIHLPNSLQQIIIAIVPIKFLIGSFEHIDNFTFSWIIEQCDPRIVFVMQPARNKVHTSLYDRRWTVDRIKECILFDTLEPFGDWCTSSPGRKDIWDKATEMQEKVARLRLNPSKDSELISITSSV